MVTFGFSAFLKVLSLNEKPQLTAIRKRLAPSSDAYDFHRGFRRLAHRYLVNGEELAHLIASAETIAQPPERKSAIAALELLETWRNNTPGKIINFGSVVFESPRHLFRVRFEPDFGILHQGRPTAIHIWNTKLPKLSLGPTRAALALVAQAFQDQQNKPEDVGVLSLREPVATYLLSDSPNPAALSKTLIEYVEEIIRKTPPGGPPGPAQPEDRPDAR